MSRKKHRPLEQLTLFTDGQLRAMAKPAKKKKPAKKGKAAPVPRVRISDEELAAMAFIDCLRDAGYQGDDPVYDFFTGNHPTDEPRGGRRRN